MTDGARTRIRVLAWVAAGLALIALAALGWTAFRLLATAESLQRAADSATDLEIAVTGGAQGDELDVYVGRIRTHAENAVGQTGDIVWSAVEAVPFLGANLSATRIVAEEFSDLADEGVPELVSAAQRMRVDAAGIDGSRVSLASYTAAAESLAPAAAAFESAARRLDGIDDGFALPAVQDLVARMTTAVDDVARLTDSLDTASSLLPTMLGGDGRRSYVLVLQGGGSTRASGGTANALALVQADGGTVTVVRTVRPRDLPTREQPVIDLDATTAALFDDGPARSVHSALGVPDFTVAGGLIAALWQDRFGDRIDGVVAVDGAVVAELLRHREPLDVGAFTIDASTAVDVLAFDIARDATSADARDDAFRDTITRVFARITGESPPVEESSASPSLTRALDAAALDGGIRIWSAHPDEQAALAGTTLGGAIPADPGAAVYVNDLTGGALAVFTDADIEVEHASCDDAGVVRVRIAWSNGAPVDAAETLGESVTGGALEPGHVRTRFTVYGPAGWALSSAAGDVDPDATRTADDDGSKVSQVEMDVAPGAIGVVTIEFRGPRALDEVSATVSPLVGGDAVTVSSGACD